MHERLHQVLMKNLSEQQATVAVTILETDFARANTGTLLVKFVDTITQTFSLSESQQHTLRMQLSNALLTDRSAKVSAQPYLVDTKETSTDQQTDATDNPLSSVSPGLVVFVNVARYLIEAVRDYGFNAYNDFNTMLHEQLERSGLPKVMQDHMLTWFIQPNRLPPYELSRSDLGPLTNLLYIAICDAVGPSDGDRILNQAIREAEKLDEARSFSPRNLL